jgi:CDP-glycerol glycerophosphotransferase
MILQLIKFRQVQFLQAILSLLPVSNNKIVFANFLGRGMGGSPKYIAEEMFRQGLPYDLGWRVMRTNLFLLVIRPSAL